MLSEDLTALVMLAGRTLVAGATSDGWQVVKTGFARLLGRRNQAQAQLAEDRLEQTRHELAGLQGDELLRARSTLETQWTTRLADLLEEEPDSAADLRALVGQLEHLTDQTGPAVSAADHAIAAAGDVNIRADHGGVAAGVLHGDVVPANPR